MNRTDLTRTMQRLTLMLSGEAMQSGFHFALNIALLRVLSARDFGVFAIVMVIGGLSLAYIRALTGMPATVLIGRSRTRLAADAYDVTFGSGAALLSVLIAICVDLLLNVWLDAGAFAGGCFVGLWSMRSYLRMACFARRQQMAATVGDLAFILSGAVIAFALWGNGEGLLPRVFLALAAANGISIAVMLTLSHRPFRISYRSQVRQRYARLWHQLGWSGLSVTASNVQGQAVALLVTGFGGPAAYAPIAAALVFFTPLRITATALGNMLQPELSAELARGERAHVWRQTKIWSLIAGLAGLVYGVAIIIMLPRIESHALEGSPVRLIGFFACVIYTMIMLYIMPRILLEVMTAFRTVAAITAAAAVVSAALVVVILMVAPPALALAGGAASEALVVAASWVVIYRKLHVVAGVEGAGQAFMYEPHSSAHSSSTRTKGQGA
jgi:O-antigen/teichoic acid export membrane protein